MGRLLQRQAVRVALAPSAGGSESERDLSNGVAGATGGAWSNVFVGCDGAPSEHVVANDAEDEDEPVVDEPRVSVVGATPVVAEKPFVAVNDDGTRAAGADVETGSGGAAAATWIFRGGRRGGDANMPWETSRGAAAAAT